MPREYRNIKNTKKLWKYIKDLIKKKIREKFRIYFIAYSAACLLYFIVGYIFPDVIRRETTNLKKFPFAY